MFEYRVVWKREGQRKKTRKSKSLKIIQKWLWLLGDTPWKAFGKEPDAHVCCAGGYNEMCACGGITYEEQAEQKKAEQPKIEYIRVEYRHVGPWAEGGLSLVDDVLRKAEQVKP